MTTSTMTRLESGEESSRSLRIAPVTANLLPEEITQARRGRTVRWGVVVMVVMVALSVTGWYAFAVYQTVNAETELTRTEDEAAALTNQKKAFAEVIDAQKQSAAIKSQLKTLMADDLSWSTLSTQVRGAAPADVVVSSLHAAVERQQATESTKDKDLPNSPGATVIGTLALEGTAPSMPLVSDYVDALAKINGLDKPYITNATTDDEGTVSFTVEVDVTAAILGGRHTPADSDKTTGGR